MRTNLKVFTILNGWIVQAGCQLIAYTSRRELIDDLDSWAHDPAGTEKRILAKAVNRKITLGDQPMAMDANQAPGPLGTVTEAGRTCPEVPATPYPPPPMTADTELHELLNRNR